MWAFASTGGRAAIRTDPRSFVEAFTRRVEAGLLTGRPHQRSRYEVTRVGTDRLTFSAKDAATAFNVGLNEVEVAVTSPGEVTYDVRCPRWAGYAVALSAVLGGALAVTFLLFDVRGYAAAHPELYLGLSPDQSVALAWGMALFWGVAWPWILIALHKRPLRRLMERLIAEVDAEAVQRSATTR